MYRLPAMARLLWWGTCLVGYSRKLNTDDGLDVQRSYACGRARFGSTCFPVGGVVAGTAMQLLQVAGASMSL